MDSLDTLLWMPENLPANTHDRIHLYNDSVLAKLKVSHKDFWVFICSGYDFHMVV